MIDNLTNQYVYIPNAGRYIPPFTHNVAVPLNGTQAAQIQWKVPAGLVQQPQDTTQQCVATWTSTPVVQSANNAVMPPQSGYGSFTTLNTAATGSVAAGSSATLFATLDTVKDRFIKYISLVAGPTAQSAAASGGFITIVGHSSATSKNVLGVAVVGAANAVPTPAVWLPYVIDVQQFLTVATDALYDVKYNANGTSSYGTSNILTAASPT